MNLAEIMAMNPAYVALAGFAGWTLILILTVANLRMANFFTGKKAINAFLPTGEDLPGFGHRVTRAHANSVENLPIFAALIAVAGLSEQLSIVEGTAMYVLYARIGQSVNRSIGGPYDFNCRSDGMDSRDVFLRANYFDGLVRRTTDFLARLAKHQAEPASIFVRRLSC